MMKKEELARYIDQTNLKLGMTEEFIEDFCEDAAKNGFASVCILPNMVPIAAKTLKGSNTKVCTVISFPLGADVPVVKIAETEDVIKLGAEEVDLVVNPAAVKSEDWDTVEAEIKGVVEVAHKHNVLVKTIIETPLISEEQIKKVSKLAEDLGVDIVKTSTGFKPILPRTTSVEDVKIIRSVIKSTTGVKAAGGISDTKTALAMISAGATRLGASSGKDIIEGLR